MSKKHDVTLLARLLGKTQEEVIDEALDCYVKHAVPPAIRSPYNNVMDVLAQTAPNHNGNGSAAERYRLSEKATGLTFNPDKTRGRIMSRLRELPHFGREEFRQVVATAMAWNPTTSKFGISTKFQTLDEADRAWWGTFKGRDKFIQAAL
jgi:hypothetical protein